MAGRGTPEQPLPEEAALEQTAGTAFLEHLADANPVLLERLLSVTNAQLVLLFPGQSYEAKKEYWNARVKEREYLQAHATAVLAHALNAKFGAPFDEDVAMSFLGTKDDAKLHTFMKRAFTDVTAAYRTVRTTYAALHETIGLPTRLVPMDEFHLPGHVDLGRERPLPEAIPAAAYAARRALGTASLIRSSTALSGLVAARSAHFGVFHELRQLQDLATGVQRLHRRLLDPLAPDFPHGRSLRTRYACDPETGMYVPFVEGYEDPKAQKLPEDLCAEIILRLRAESRGAAAEGPLAPLDLAVLVEEARATGDILVADPGVRAWRDFGRGLKIVDQRHAHHEEGAEQLNAILEWLNAQENNPLSEHSIIPPLVQMLSLRRTRAVPKGDDLFVRFLDTSDRLVLSPPSEDTPACTADFYELTPRGYLPQWRARIFDTPEGMVSAASLHPALAAARGLVDATLDGPTGSTIATSLGDEGAEAFRHHAAMGLLRLVTLLGEHGKMQTPVDKRRLAGKLSQRFTVPELHARPLTDFNAAMAPRFAAYVPPMTPPVAPPNPARGARMFVALASGRSKQEAERYAASPSEVQDALPVPRDMFTMLENRQHLRDALWAYMHGATGDDAIFDTLSPEEHVARARADQRARYDARARAQVRALLPRNPDAVIKFIRKIRFDTFLQFLHTQEDPDLAHTLERRIAESLDELSAQYLDVARRPPRKRRTREDRQDVDPDAPYEQRDFVEEEALPGYGGYREFTQLATIAWALGFSRFTARIPQLAAIEPADNSLAQFFRKLRIFAKYFEDVHVNLRDEDLVQTPRILGDALVEDLSLSLIEQILNGPNGERLATELRAILTRILPDAVTTYSAQCVTYEFRVREVSRIQSERSIAGHAAFQRKKKGLPPLPRPHFPKVDKQEPSASLRIAIGQLASVAHLVDLDPSVFNSTRAFHDVLAAFYPDARNPMDAFHKDVQTLDARQRAYEIDPNVIVIKTTHDKVVHQLEYLERELVIVPKSMDTTKSRLEKALDGVLDVVRLPDRIREVQHEFLVAAHVRDAAVRSDGPIDVRVLHTPATRSMLKGFATRLVAAGALGETLAHLAQRGAFADKEIRAFWTEVVVGHASELRKRLTDEYLPMRRPTMATTALYQALHAIGYVDALDGAAYPSPDLAALGTALDASAPWLADTVRVYIAHYAQHVHGRKTWELEIAENR